MNRKFHKRRWGKVILCTLSLSIPQLFCNSAIGQNVTFKGNNTPLTIVFKSIYTQTGFAVSGPSNLIKNSRNVSLDVKDMPIFDLLELVLKGQNLTAIIEGKTIILQPVPSKVSTRNNQAPVVQDTMILITGRVLDRENKPLPGASIRVQQGPGEIIPKSKLKDVTRQWKTDIQGRFSLLCFKGEELIVTSVGYESMTFQALTKTQDKIIILEESTQKLDDVVVTGIFTRKAESFTGAAQTFSKEELFRVGNSNVIQSLKNLDPSFNIVQNLAVGSDPNALPAIQLRGQSGFPDLRGEYQTDPNQPLFILDGFEASLTRIIDLDMNRIKSVTILKDAAAKAMYGSKAANGVVVIETERPKEGKIRLSYTGNLNIQAPDLSSYNLTNAKEKLSVERDAGLYKVSGTTSDPNQQFLLDQEYNRILEEVLKGVNTDWLSKPVRTGIGQKHTIRVDGGSQNLQYGVDVSYNNNEGAMKGSSRKTVSGAVDLAYRTSKFAIRNEIVTIYNKGLNSPYGSFNQYASMNPYFRPYDENGKITQIAGETLITGVVANPLWNTTINTKDFNTYLQVLDNFYIDWFVSKNWKLTGRSSIMRQENTTEVFLPASHTNFINYTSDELVQRKGNYRYGDGSNTSVNADLISSYSKTFGKHLLFINTNLNMSSSTNRSANFIAEGFPNDFMDNISFARQYQENGRPSGTENTTRDLGALMAVNYSYDDRYLLDASYRLNGSSQFGSDNRWGQFWSTGLGWNIHHEKFASSWKALDQLRLRGSLGYTGSQNFNSYQARTTFTYNTEDAYLGSFGAYLLALGNNKLKWQRKFDKNIGLDLSLFNKTFSLRADYYTSMTNDLLTDVSLPASTGFSSYKENLGEVENKGYEFSLNYRIWRGEESAANYFSVYLSANHNQNRIRKISNSLATFNRQSTDEVNNRPVVKYEEGQSMSAIWAMRSYGIDPVTGNDILVRKDGTVTYDWDPTELVVVGDTQPKLRGNTGFNFAYKGWNLNVGFNWIWKAQLYNQTVVDKVENANLALNVDRRVFDERWREPGDISWFKNIKSRGITRSTERFVQKQNELVLSSINLSYDLDRLAFVKRTPLSRLRIAVNMNDISTMSTIRVERGTAYPFARTFSFSVQTFL